MLNAITEIAIDIKLKIAYAQTFKIYFLMHFKLIQMRKFKQPQFLMQDGDN